MNKQDITVKQVRSYNETHYSHRLGVNEVNADMVGLIYTSGILDDWKTAGATERGEGDYLEKMIDAWIEDEEKAAALSDTVSQYASAERTRGFREGFNIALNIIIQGMRFPTRNN